MKITVTGRTTPSAVGLPHMLSLRWLIVIVTAVMGITAALTFVVAHQIVTPERIWDWAYRKGHEALHEPEESLSAKLLSAMTDKLLHNIDVPRLVIDIKFKDFQKLTKKRDEAIEKKILVKSDDDFVPAVIRLNDGSTRVKLRLKGDATDHLDGDKWSLRIRVRGKEQLFGMRRFSIQHPWARGYQGEALFFETLHHLGVLAPRHFFVDVTVNGNDIGVMAVEEHFSKELLESNQRKESVIVRFDEALVWQAEDGENLAGLGGVFDNYMTNPIDAFGSSRIRKSAKLTIDNQLAIGLLRGFVDGSLPPSTVFDAEIMGRFIAAAELWGTWHSFSWRNMRFYYNPLTARLEPIGFDASPHFRSAPGRQRGTDMPIVQVLRQQLLADERIFSIFKTTLRELREEIASEGDFLITLKSLEAEHLSILRREFYLLEGFQFSELIERADLLLALDDAGIRELKFSEQKLPALIHAWLIDDADQHYLELSNLVTEEVAIDSIVWVNRQNGSELTFDNLSPLISSLAPTPQAGAPKLERIYYRAPDAAEDYELRVSTRIINNKSTYTANATRYFPALPKHPIPESTPEQQLAQHPFLRFDVDTREFRVKPGRWQVEGSILIPAQTSLEIAAGTTLEFQANEGIISRGPVNMRGSGEAPVRLLGSGGRPGEPGTWQGIVVLNAGESSHWSHAHISHTTGVSRAGWELTGGVTFYKSDIEMDNTLLAGSQVEDALNIIHSDFRLNDLTIENTVSDAFDADFSDGTVTNGLFREIGKAGGGDAIDISGSDVTVTGTRFDSISDKALSVGEGSIMRVTGVHIDDAGTGAAAKDGSILTIAETEMQNIRFAGLMAYIKKPEYGGAEIDATNIRFIGDLRRALAQTDSRITIDGTDIESEDLDIEKMYDTIMKPGMK